MRPTEPPPTEALLAGYSCIAFCLLLWLAHALVCAFLAGMMADSQGRFKAGFLLGLMFGFLGIILAMFLPPVRHDYRPRRVWYRDRRRPKRPLWISPSPTPQEQPGDDIARLLEDDQEPRQ